MKSIELTKEQREKLLEMCNKLFSEQGKWFNILDGCIYFSKNGRYPGKYIHWFEFCLTHLIIKLGLYWYNYTRYQSEEGPTHLVDYLYKQFKELNNGS